jgi:hypothetical protein
MKTKTNVFAFFSASWITQAPGLIVFIGVMLAFGALAQPVRAQQIGIPGTDGSAFRNVAILGLDPQSSFVRFGNFRDGEPVRNYVEVYSLTQGKTIGRFELNVPARGAAQLSFLDIVSAAGLDLTTASTQELALYVQNGREKQVWQHVQYDARTESLVNASACSFSPEAAYIPPSNVAMNVHTSTIGHIRSLITIHNFADEARHLDVRVTDARTGQEIGVVPISLEPRSSFNEEAAWFENELGFRPARNQYHVNIEVNLLEGSKANPNVIVAHALFNTRTEAVANLSAICSIHGGTITLDDPV